ncbi:MAG: YbjN domain-containing protein [Myxococcales bacterium]|nr:YbjN domain-containing protein [Myxococcales bacterium]
MSDLLAALHRRIEDEIDGVTATPDGLRAVVDARFGEVTLCIDHDDDEEMVRVSAAVAPPAGAGRSFLVWCLALNGRYWDVKLGLDSKGRLLVHSDLDADEGVDPERLSEAVVERVEAVVDVLDDDLVEWLLERDMGTPDQRERWMSREDRDVEDES